jgi:hypothetical protein
VEEATNVGDDDSTAEETTSGEGSKPNGGHPPTDPAAERWLAEVRVEDAARERSRVAQRQALDAAEATLAGVLGDLAARGEVVQLWMHSGRRHRGWLRLIGPDACVMDTETRQWAVVRLAAIASVRTVRSAPVPGQSEASTASSFASLAGALAVPGEWVLVGAGPESIGGVLEVAGTDVLRLRLENGDVAYVPLASVDEVTLTPTRG